MNKILDTDIIQLKFNYKVRKLLGMSLFIKTLLQLLNRALSIIKKTVQEIYQKVEKKMY